MPEGVLANPATALAPSADFTAYTDKDGNLIAFDRIVRTYRANETIAAKQAVAFVAATTTVPLSVEKLDVSDAIAAFVFAGVALEAGVAGDLIQVCVQGPCIVNIDDSGAIALGDICVKHGSTDGATTLVANATWTADATAAAGPGKALGVFLGPEIGTTNTAPVYVNKL